jgi:hypothetical protein
MAEYRLTRPLWTGDKTLYRAGTREISDAHAKELGLLKSDKPAATGDDGGTLDGVDFASEAAREAAQEAGLTASDFKGASPSSANGFTKPDVTALAEAKA